MKKILFALILCLMLLVGCDEVTDSADRSIPDLYGVGDFFFRDYRYLIDRNTHVVYLEKREDKGGGIVVMLNADGTPVTAEQLEIEVK